MKLNSFLSKCVNKHGIIVIHWNNSSRTYDMEDRDYLDFVGFTVITFEIRVNDLMVPEIHVFVRKEDV